MHYSDNLDLEDGGVWEDVYDDLKVVERAILSIATHQLEHGQKGRGGIWYQRGRTGILVMVIVLCNNGYFVVPIIQLIKEMALKLRMVCQLNLIYVDGVPT